MAEITELEVKQAEAHLAEVKEAYRGGNGDAASYKAAKQQVSDLRQAWRQQELAAGRRAAGAGLGGGDAAVAPPTIETTST